MNSDRVNLAIDNLIVALNELKGALAEQGSVPAIKVVPDQNGGLVFKTDEPVSSVTISDEPPMEIKQAVQKQFAESAKESAPAAAAARFCHMCGAELIVGDRFCINCGTPVED